MVTVASCPSSTLGMSVSSTSTSASITERSAIVASTVPWLFMVPTTTVSPSSMLRRVTTPEMGEVIVTLVSSYRALSRLASSWRMRWAWVATSTSRACSSVSLRATSFSACS